jgi:hypothetical protein
LGAVSFVGLTVRVVSADAAPYVLSLCDRLKVRREYAIPDTAEMVNGQPVRNWADEGFIREAMRLQTIEAAVALLIPAASPNETARRIRLDFRQEPPNDCLKSLTRRPKFKDNCHVHAPPSARAMAFSSASPAHGSMCGSPSS